MQNPDNFISGAVETYSDTIYKIAYNITCNREDALDVCQDVFLRLIKNKHKIRDDAHLKAWLIRTCINCAKSNVSQSYKKHRVPIENADRLSYCDSHDSMIDLVFRLPEKYRTVIHLFYYDRLDISEIANILSLTKSGVKSRLARGRAMLKDIIEKENYV